MSLWTLTVQSIVDDGKNFHVNYLVFDGVSTTYGPTLLLLPNAMPTPQVSSILQTIISAHPISPLQMIQGQVSAAVIKPGVYSLVGTSLTG